jgi:hypothetical protein
VATQECNLLHGTSLYEATCRVRLSYADLMTIKHEVRTTDSMAIQHIRKQNKDLQAFEITNEAYRHFNE